MKVTAIILAAGASRRMGRPKQTLPFAGSTIIGTVVANVLQSSVSDVVVVLSPQADEARRLLSDYPIQLLENPDPDRGMLTSVQIGIAQCPTDPDAYLIALGDQPQIGPSIINGLISAAADSDHGIVIPSFGGKRGHPVLFKARYRDQILGLDQEASLKELVSRHPADVLELPVESGSVLIDIDTPEDYQAAIAAEN